MNLFRFVAVAVALSTVLLTRSAGAESAIELLSGFDEERIEAAYPPSNEKTFGELAKLIYRLKNISRDSVQSKLPTEASDSPEVS